MGLNGWRLRPIPIPAFPLKGKVRTKRFALGSDYHPPPNFSLEGEEHSHSCIDMLREILPHLHEDGLNIKSAPLTPNQFLDAQMP